MDASAPRLGRRSYVVDRRFQYKYTLLLALVGSAIAAAFGGLMYLAHVDALAALGDGRALGPQVARQSTILLGLMLGLTLLLAAALGMFGLLFTHRVAGPVHVLGHYVGVLARGRYPIMRPLRKGDELQAFFERFQEAVESLREREAAEAEVLEEVVETLSALLPPEQAQELLEKLRQMSARKRDATDRILLGGDEKSAA